jgi:hypothetical protein
MQQAEVQEVTFSAGIGLGGSATLTYTDLYGQDWTTRPINLGDGLHYVLDYALGTSATGAATAGQVYLALTYGGTTVECGNTHATNTAALIREKLLGAATIGAATDLAKSIRVTKRPDRTSHKFAGGIEANAKSTYDIYINPNLFNGLNEAGGLKAFTASLQQTGGGASTQVADGKAYVNVRLVSDASADIKAALEGLPNNVIPSVTVTNSGYTTASTNDEGTYGNAYRQSYSITFSSSSNTGDQNMLSCDADPCDDDGCANRKSGASSIMYMHHDYTFGAKSDHASTPGAGSTAITQKVPKVNFQGQGYFIMDIHRDTSTNKAAGDFSSGNAFVDWNTGAGVERAEFPIIATAATVQTSLRGITGWSGVTVTSQCAPDHASAGSWTTAVSPCTNLDIAHSYTVTFPSGYDDGGQTPRVGLVAGYGGAASVPDGTADGAIIIYDQRFSNSLWLGDITGWTPVTCTKTTTLPDYCNVGTVGEDATIQGENGDNYKITIVNFGHLDQSQAQGSTEINSQAKATTFSNVLSVTSSKGDDFGLPATALSHTSTKAYIMVDNDAAFPTATSQNTGEHFAVGSTIEVLPQTWDRTDRDADIPDGGIVANAYRSFKVLSHVSNVHGQTFAKLDSTPTTASGENYALKVTTHNSTVSTRTGVTLNAAQGEVQEIHSMANNLQATHADDQYRIYINANKPNVEFTEILTGGSTNAQVAEAINAFSALSGPVTVLGSGTGGDLLKKITVSFSDIDGDVPELTVVKLVDGAANDMSVVTTKQGWSFFAGQSARLENVSPGSVINITASEEVTFSITGWSSGDVIFSYDGTVASAGLAYASANGGTNADVVAAIDTIVDEKGAKKITTTCTVTPTKTVIKVNMPAGADGSKLDLLVGGAAGVTAITKSVAKNNNGKSFKVLRVMNQAWPMGVPNATDPTSVTFEQDKGPFVVGDEIRAQQSTAGNMCKYNEGDIADGSAIVYYHHMPITQITESGGASTKLTATPKVGSRDATGCTFTIYRTTLVVDSKPDAFSGSVDMMIEGAKGSCSVSETVKGTYESDVCSSRGNCDGASGLCTCHEGYSGEACETQTVLV